MKRGFITMNEPLPVEIKIFTDEMEKHMLKYFDNLSKNKIEEAKKSEKAYRDSVIELIKLQGMTNRLCVSFLLYL